MPSFRLNTNSRSHHLQSRNGRLSCTVLIVKLLLLLLLRWHILVTISQREEEFLSLLHSNPPSEETEGVTESPPDRCHYPTLVHVVHRERLWDS